VPLWTSHFAVAFAVVFAVAVAVAFAFLSVIPAGNLLSQKHCHPEQSEGSAFMLSVMKGTGFSLYINQTEGTGL
jgi:hypothetical protein